MVMYANEDKNKGKTIITWNKKWTARDTFKFGQKVHQGEMGKEQFRFLGNCPPTPPLSHHFALSEK